MKAHFLVRAALVAGIYAVLTILMAPISFGPVQVRLAEALTVLPFVDLAAIPGLFIGVLIANVFGQQGPWDIFGGSLITLVAAVLTYYARSPKQALLPPIVLNAFGVSAYLSFLFGLPYWLTVLSVGAGQVVAVGFVGYPFLTWVMKHKDRLGLSRQRPSK